MDLQGITWVGHMYQKFETMCLEVEEVMYQDTVKFVENQVQTVSTNVKRFYSDVLQDLADPSMEEHVKDLHKFKNSKQDGIEGKTNRKPSLADNFRPPSVEKMKKHLSRVSSLTEQPNENFEAWHDLRTSSPVSVGLGLDSVRESFDDEINNASEVATSALNDAPPPGIAGNEEMKMALSFSNGSLAESCEQPDERTLDIMSSAVLDMETCQQLEIEESCHIVNGADLPNIPQKEKKQKAYKMRIRDAISSRMTSTRKQEYKQLAVSFEEHGKSKQGSNEHSRSTICETEWEIL